MTSFSLLYAYSLYDLAWKNHRQENTWTVSRVWREMAHKITKSRTRVKWLMNELMRIYCRSKPEKKISFNIVFRDRARPRLSSLLIRHITPTVDGFKIIHICFQ